MEYLVPIFDIVIWTILITSFIYKSWTKPRGYTPLQLGLNLPEVKKIYLGKCGRGDIDLGEPKDIPDMIVVGHTHTSLDSPQWENVICLYDDKSGFYHEDTVKHEYAHVLDIDSHISRKGLTEEEIIGLQERFHGPTFEVILASLENYPILLEKGH